MAGRARLRAADSLMAPAVAETIRALPVEAQDAGAVRLAERLATAIDGADPETATAVLVQLSGRLLAVLVELGATPRARAQVGRPVTSPDGALARLRSAGAS